MGGKQYAIGKARTVNGIYYPSFSTVAHLLEEYNCLHFKFPILLGISRPAYSDDELAELKANDKKTFEFEGNTYTGYDGTQMQRKIETKIRKQKDIANMAKTAGDDDLRREAQYKINVLKNKYVELSKASGLPTKMERASVAGFRPVKTVEQLTQTQNRAILKKKIASGEIKLEMNPEKQGRHLKDSQYYKQGKSYFSVDANEIQNIINEKSGTGKFLYDKNGEWKKKEQISCDKIIGVNISPKTGEETETSLATIHYSNTGTHLVPRRE